MTKCLAFVLGGGGARGALQVGAMRALFEAGLKPDLLVGTSIGAVNAAGLTLWGVDMAGIEALEYLYQRIADSGIMDPRLAEFILNSVSRRPNQRGNRLAREFMIAEGISPELRFNPNAGVRLAVVGADLDTGEPVIFGQDPEHTMLEGVMASMAVPPWFAPINLGGHSIIDGGAVSNLPIEAALRLGATEIVALDLNDAGGTVGSAGSPSWYVDRLLYASARRVADLEKALATAQGVPVHYLALKSSPSIPIWDFASHRRLVQVGYEIAAGECARWPRSNAKPAGPDSEPARPHFLAVLTDGVRRVRAFFRASANSRTLLADLEKSLGLPGRKE